jgi:DNA-binding GntR family transcriptional regulator
MYDSPLFARMREAILSLELTPGQRVSERGLEPIFGASRTPIRAALLRLEADGLVIRDGRTWTVAPLDLDELTLLSEYRGILESAVVRLVIERADDAALASIAELAPAFSTEFAPGRGSGYGRSFHRELAQLAENPFLSSALEGVLTRLHRTRWLELRTPNSRELARVEHQEIMDALLARDTVAAELAVSRHLAARRERLTASVDTNRTLLRGGGLTLDRGVPAS